MKKIASSLITITSLLTIVCAFISFNVNAHPGHDHNHWMSDIHHVSGSIAVIIGLSIAMYYFLKNRQIKSKNSRGDK